MNRKQFSDKYAAQIAGDRDGHRLIMAGKMDRDLDECIRTEIITFVDEFIEDVRKTVRRIKKATREAKQDQAEVRTARAFQDGGELMLKVLREYAVK
jgi:hypothetical protein